MRLIMAAAVALTMLISGCDNDGIEGENASDIMLREAMCVVASERFQLYDEAKKHHQHGLEADRFQFKFTEQPGHFTQLIHRVRLDLNGKTKEFNAAILEENCNRSITVGEMDSV